LDFDEFCQLHEFIMKSQQTFVSFDTNRDGFLGRDEVREALTQAGVAPVSSGSLHGIWRGRTGSMSAHAARLHHAFV
jgi:Ca2+-binding EF-hand superfamily protein